jgi:hypothetical protein
MVALSVTETATGVSWSVVARLVAVVMITSSEFCASAGVTSDAVRAVVTAKMDKRDAIDNPLFISLLENNMAYLVSIQ